MRRPTPSSPRARGRLALAAPALVLGLAVGGLVAGCGSDTDGAAGSSDHASTSDFCSTWADLDLTGGKKELDVDTSEWASEAMDVGTPDDMTDAARRGYVLLVNALADASDSGGVDEALDSLEEGTAKQTRALAAFLSYLLTTCEDDSTASASASASASS
ncbi:hypothetical protein [Nocardioides sp. GY 10127]|uniref:hypothetical protein n=1 Tax=Nocardioides sp. GY 10127 TaxID=2569762 RepID=UPI0010A84BC0|nr:hypothetical protein [Nocardioides sp. GY 10127]TIC82718.1 hypothetical protein E8D37_08480 [Nocardioides sp. GY 10127]